MDEDDPLGISDFDATDCLTSEERIAAYLEEAYKDDGSFATLAEHEAFIRQAQEDVLRARVRWGIE